MSYNEQSTIRVREVLKRKGCREMRFTGKPMKGFVFVGPEGRKVKRI